MTLSRCTGFSGWMDSASGNHTPLTSNTTVLAVNEGGSFILECNPRTNDPSISDVSAVWTRNRMLIDPGDDGIVFVGERNSTLLIRNFSFGGENVNVTFQCLFSGLRYLRELKRTFVISPGKGQLLPHYTSSLFMCKLLLMAIGTWCGCANE